MFLNGWMVKHGVVYSYYGIQIHNIKEQSIDIHNYLDGFPKNYVTLKNASPQRLHGEGNGTPLQYSCLENPMDGEAW